MKITQSQLRQIIKEELSNITEGGAMGHYERPSSPHAGKSVEEIVSWHTDKWDKNISDYGKVMHGDMLSHIINTMMYAVTDSMREPGVQEEYYAHLSDEEYARLEEILNQELKQREM